jgi:type IV pilus assembly protein PilB
MEKRPKFIGEILIDLGLITAADVDRALAFQRERGGFFGEALIQLGVLSPDQLNFGLADQFDLPFVNLKPDNIDQGVARMVPAEWARERLIIPVLRDGDSVTVMVARPPSESELAIVRRFTCASSVEPAISSAGTVRSLIAAVHADGCGEEIPVMELLERAVAADAQRAGVSSRAGRARGWYRGAVGTIQCCITSGWEADLQLALTPPRVRPEAVVHWPAVLTSGARAWRVECTLASGGGGVEWVAELGIEVPKEAASPPMTEELSAAVAAHEGGLLVAAACSNGVPAELAELVIPVLPRAILQRRPRSVHLTDRPVAALPEVMVVAAGDAPHETLRALAPLKLDAVTLQLDAYSPRTIAAAREAAPLVVIRSSGGPAVPDVELKAELAFFHDSFFWTLSSSSVPHGAD